MKDTVSLWWIGGGPAAGPAHRGRLARRGGRVRPAGEAARSRRAAGRGVRPAARAARVGDDPLLARRADAARGPAGPRRDRRGSLHPDPDLRLRRGAAPRPGGGRLDGPPRGTRRRARAGRRPAARASRRSASTSWGTPSASSTAGPPDAPWPAPRAFATSTPRPLTCAANAANGFPITPARSPPMSRKNTRILIVDDEEIVRESLGGWLEKDGYTLGGAPGRRVRPEVRRGRRLVDPLRRPEDAGHRRARGPEAGQGEAPRDRRRDHDGVRHRRHGRPGDEARRLRLHREAVRPRGALPDDPEDRRAADARPREHASSGRR